MDINDCEDGKKDFCDILLYVLRDILLYVLHICILPV